MVASRRCRVRTRLNRLRPQRHQRPGDIRWEGHLPNSPFEEVAIADVADRLQLERHFSFHEYDGDDRIIRHYNGDAVIDGDLDLDALFWDGVAGIWAEKDLIVNGSIFNW